MARMEFPRENTNHNLLKNDATDSIVRIFVFSPVTSRHIC